MDIPEKYHPRSPLLSIPREIRFMIYGYFLLQLEETVIDSKYASLALGPGSTNILRVNREISEEALQYLYGENLIAFVWLDRRRFQKDDPLLLDVEVNPHITMRNLYRVRSVYLRLYFPPLDLVERGADPHEGLAYTIRMMDINKARLNLRRLCTVLKTLPNLWRLHVDIDLGVPEHSSCHSCGQDLLFLVELLALRNRRRPFFLTGIGRSFQQWLMEIIEEWEKKLWRPSSGATFLLKFISADTLGTKGTPSVLSLLRCRMTHELHEDVDLGGSKEVDSEQWETIPTGSDVAHLLDACEALSSRGVRAHVEGPFLDTNESKITSLPIREKSNVSLVDSLAKLSEPSPVVQTLVATAIREWRRANQHYIDMVPRSKQISVCNHIKKLCSYDTGPCEWYETLDSLRGLLHALKEIDHSRFTSLWEAFRKAYELGCGLGSAQSQGTGPVTQEQQAADANCEKSNEELDSEAVYLPAMEL
ncbi:MAG: hypothetical protein M1833_004786 [Piccolia ochrophora]|nr:MAG: hypothetical protein M1833_004786 [Piccolia ochrophora]